MSVTTPKSRPREKRAAENWYFASRVFCLVALVVVMPGAISGQVVPPDSVRVGVLRDWPPYYTLDDSGQPDGFAVETFEAIAERSNLQPHYVIFETFPQMIEALRSGRIDVIPNIGVVEGRVLLYSVPVDTFSIAFFIRTSTPGSPDLDHVTGRVAVVRSNVGKDIIASHSPAIEVAEYASVREAIFRLISGDVDGLVYPEPVVWALAREAGIDDRIEMTDPELGEIKRAIGVSPGRDALLSRLNATIEPFILSDDYRRIRERWLAPPPSYWTVRRVLLAAVCSLAIVVVFFVIVYWSRQRQTSAVLSRSEARYRTLFESIQDAILVADTDRRIVAMNPAFEKLFGYRADEMIGSFTRVLYANESDYERVGENLRSLPNEANFISIVTFRTKQGQSFRGETNIFHLRDDQGAITGLVGIIRDVTHELENRAELDQKRRDLERLSAQLIGAQETERARIARELHDELGGILTALYFDVSWLHDHVGDPPVLGKVATMGEQIERATKRVREVARDLRPQVIDDFGLVPAIEDLLSEFSGRFGIDGHLSVDSREIELHRDLDINIYRIVQEALTNVARHSGASRVDLRLRLDNGTITAEIHDDGRGASDEELQSTTSLGIVGMRERAEMMGGTLTIDTSVGEGTTVRACIPIESGGR